MYGFVEFFKGMLVEGMFILHMKHIQLYTYFFIYTVEIYIYLTFTHIHILYIYQLFDVPTFN